MADLDTINSTLQEQNKIIKASGEDSATQQAKAAEQAAEDKVYDSEVLDTLQEIAGNIKDQEIKIPKEDSGSWAGAILKGLGLIGAGAAGLAAGLLVGWIDFVGDLLKRLGKLFKLDKIKMPKWLDNFFKAFTKEGALYKNTMKYIDDFKAPKWLDDFFKQFTKEGKIAKKVIAIIDDFKMPKFLDDFFKAFTKEGKIAQKVMGIIDNFKMPKFTFITKIGDFFKAAGSAKFKEISKAIDGVMDLFPKGAGGGFLGKMFKGIGDVFKPIGELWKNVKGSFTTLTKLFGPGGGKITKIFTKFLTPFKTVFKAFAGLGKAIAAPLTIIMGIIDGCFEAKDAVGKSEGIMATMVNTVVGAIGGFIDGAIFQLLDLLKSGVSWIAGFFGFDEVEKFLDSFSFSAMFNEFLDDVYAWFNLLFSDPVAALTNLIKNYFGAILTVGDFIVDMLKKPIIWIMGLFGWDDAAAATEKFSFKDTVMNVFNSAVTWIKNLFADPVAGLTELLGTIAAGYLTILDFITAPLKKGIAWILRLFGWDEAAEATETFSFKTTIMDAFDAAVKWVTDLFTWSQEPVKEGDSFIVKTVKDVVKTVKDWFGSLFKFDSTSDVITSLVNVVLWLPNLVTKGISAVTAWFLKLLGFNEKSKAVADAGKKFNFGDMVMKAITAIIDFFDKMLNFDFAKFAKGMMPAKLYDWIFGGGQEVSEAAKRTVAAAESKFTKEGSEKSSKELVEMGLLDKDWWSKDNLELEKIQKALMGQQTKEGGLTSMGRTMISALTEQLGDKDINEEERRKLSEILERAKGTHLKAIAAREKKLATDAVVAKQASKNLEKGAQLLDSSRKIEQSKSSGSAVVVNNINTDNSQTNSSKQMVHIKVPESVRKPIAVID